MTIISHTASHRSRLYQLLALGFAHPVEEFHGLLIDGSYGQALGATSTVAGSAVAPRSLVLRSFAEYEAGYITLFQMGTRGKPMVSLNAGDYPTLNGDASRPEFLLRYADWYRHFGLRADTGEDANELPDHLVCQLEFLAWLSHLETQAAENDEASHGYRRAQHDFIERHLEPFLSLLAENLQRQQQGDPVAEFFYALVTDAALISAAARLQLANAIVTDSPFDKQQDSDQIDAVNLWG